MVPQYRGAGDINFLIHTDYPYFEPLMADGETGGFDAIVFKASPSRLIKFLAM